MHYVPSTGVRGVSGGFTGDAVIGEVAKAVHHFYPDIGATGNEIVNALQDMTKGQALQVAPVEKAPNFVANLIASKGPGQGPQGPGL